MPTALLSVYSKEGIVDFARQLVELGWSIIASGGTAKALTKAGIQVRDVADLVGGGPILGHRVVTLSREVHAGLLSRDSVDDLQEMERLGLPRIDMACVDLYPLQAEIDNPNGTRESVIEQTDIGGPTMLRSAAKGQRIVICDPADRQKVVDWLKAGQPDKDKFVQELAAKAEVVIADYCLASATYHGKGDYAGTIGHRVLTCRYGENAHQTPATLFSAGYSDPLALDKFRVVAGAAPSYNNLCDVDRMLQTMTHIAAAFDINRGKVPFIALGVKHGNPCGAAIGGYGFVRGPDDAIQRMIAGDTRAIFGGLVMTNFQIGKDQAEELLTCLMSPGERRLLDGIVAPDFTLEAIDLLKRKGDKCRFLVNPALSSLSRLNLDQALRFRHVRGGFLAQPNYTFVLDLNDPRLVKTGQLSEQDKDSLLLAWAIGSTSNSNTITLVRDMALIGNGVGQQDRVGGCKLAVHRANESRHNTVGAVAYSDSFFPFVDGPEVLAEAGIKAILASSGSVKDEEVKKFCLEKGIVLYLIPDAVGRGFFGH